MNKLVYSESAKLALAKQKHRTTGSSLILSGKKGLGKALAGKELAASILGCDVERVAIHPDFLLIEPENGSIKVEQTKRVGEYILYVAVEAPIKIVFIDDADTMTESAQNSLLKSLEDGTKNTLYLLVCHDTSKLLPTICSRSEEIRFQTLSSEQVREVFVPEVDEIAIRICMGCPGFYHTLVKNENGFLKECKDILLGMSEMQQKRDIMSLFHCLKEKDSSLFIEKYDIELCIGFLHALKEVFFSVLKTSYVAGRTDQLEKNIAKLYEKSQLLNICTQLSKDMIKMQKKGAYNKNDFFNLVCLMSE